MNLKVAIAGASGYVGGELARLIAEHPQLDLVTVTANTNAGEKFINLHPHLRSFAHLELVSTTAENLTGHDVVSWPFLTLKVRKLQLYLAKTSWLSIAAQTSVWIRPMTGRSSTAVRMLAPGLMECPS